MSALVTTKNECTELLTPLAAGSVCHCCELAPGEDGSGNPNEIQVRIKRDHGRTARNFGTAAIPYILKPRVWSFGGSTPPNLIVPARSITRFQTENLKSMLFPGPTPSECSLCHFVFEQSSPIST